ncbi:hypothetical protein PYCC9005_003808 [Savitreella phatthalungensis]
MSGFKKPAQPGWLSREVVSINRRTAKDLKRSRWIVWSGMLVGSLWLVAMALTVTLTSNHRRFHLVFEDHFHSLANSEWQQEQFFRGQHEATFDRSTALNAFVQSGTLHLRPTLEPVNMAGATVDLGSACTSKLRADCVAFANETDAVPQINTARLRTMRSITFGRVEVEAKFPRADWLYSTISLEPADLVYGQFPGSGRIDIAQVRGNAPGYKSGGTDKLDTMLHFGAAGQVAGDNNYKARNTIQSHGRDFSQTFHTFGVQWTSDSVITYLDRPSNIMLHYTWPLGFWNIVHYNRDDPRVNHFMNPWGNGTLAAPFDVPFQLVMRINAGGLSGIFADVAAKPWSNSMDIQPAMRSFYAANSSWRTSWSSPSLQIRSVRMWQLV